MKFKKLASLLVVAAMVFAMAVPAFASNPFNGGTSGGSTSGGSDATEQGGGSTGSGTTTGSSDASATSRNVAFNGTTKIPTISVDIATSMDIILNPYGLKVELNNEELYSQLISSTLIMTNQSDCAIDVTGTVTATVAGEAKLVKDSSKITVLGDSNPDSDKNVIIGMAIGNVDAEDAVIDWATAGDSIDTDTANSGANATDKSAFSGFSSNGKSGWYLFETSGTAKNFGDTKDTNTGATNSAPAGGTPYQLAAGNEEATYLGFRLFGSASQKVKTTWTAADTISVAMTLNLTPRAVPAST